MQHQLEMNSPQLIGRDGEIWLKFIERDIPNWESKPHQPSNPKNWWKVYRKLKQEAQDDMVQDAEKLKAEFRSQRSDVPVSIIPGLGHSDMVTKPDSIRALVAAFD